MCTEIVKEPIEVEQERILREAGLNENPSLIVGRNFQFRWKDGSRFCVLTGKILAVEVSDENGVHLCVSGQHFRGMDIAGIRYKNGKWIIIELSLPRYVGTYGGQRTASESLEGKLLNY